MKCPDQRADNGRRPIGAGVIDLHERRADEGVSVRRPSNRQKA